MLPLLTSLVLLAILYACEQALRAACKQGDAEIGCERELGNTADAAYRDEHGRGHSEGTSGLSCADCHSEMTDSDNNPNNTIMSCSLTSRLTPEILMQIAEWAVWNDAQQQKSQRCSEDAGKVARGRQRMSRNNSGSDVHDQLDHGRSTSSQTRRIGFQRSSLSALSLAQTCSMSRDAVLPVIWRVIDLSCLPYRHHDNVLRLLNDRHKPHRSYVRELCLTIALGNASSPSPVPIFTSSSSLSSTALQSSYFSVIPSHSTTLQKSPHLTPANAATLLSTLGNLTSVELTFSNTSLCPPFYVSRLPGVLQDALDWLQQRGEIRHLGLSATLWQAAENDGNDEQEELAVQCNPGSVSESGQTEVSKPDTVGTMTHRVLPGGISDLEMDFEDAREVQAEHSVKQELAPNINANPTTSDARVQQPEARFPGIGHYLDGTIPASHTDVVRIAPPSSIALPIISIPTYSYATPSAAEYAQLVQFSLAEEMASRLVELFADTLRSLAIHRVTGDSASPYSSLQRAIAKCRRLRRLDLLDVDAVCDKWTADQCMLEYGESAIREMSVVNCSRLDISTLSSLLGWHADSLQKLLLVDLGRSAATSPHGAQNFPEMHLDLQTSADAAASSVIEVQQPSPVAPICVVQAPELPRLSKVSIEAEHCEIGELSLLQLFADSESCPSLREVNVISAPQLDVCALTAFLDSSHFNTVLDRRVQPFEQLEELNIVDGACPYASEQDLARLKAALARRGIAHSTL